MAEEKKTLGDLSAEEQAAALAAILKFVDRPVDELKRDRERYRDPYYVDEMAHLTGLPRERAEKALTWAADMLDDRIHVIEHGVGRPRGTAH